LKPLSLDRLPPPTSLILRIPTRSARLRLITLLYGVIVLLWLSVDDSSTTPVALIGSGLALIGMSLWVTGRYGGRAVAGRAALLAAAGAGAATGLIAAIAVAALMLVKTGLHAYLFPDYPFGMMIEMLERAPLWALAGGLAGIGLLLARWALRTPTQPPRREA